MNMHNMLVSPFSARGADISRLNCSVRENFSPKPLVSGLLTFVFASLITACNPDPGDNVFTGAQNSGSQITQTFIETVQEQAGYLLPTHGKETGSAESQKVNGNHNVSTSSIKLGTNISWFTTWAEVQPLANVFPTGRGFPDLSAGYRPGRNHPCWALGYR